ncbi:MAG TPA: hypothetical protein VMZ25_08290 [Terriglobales bacterium]|nr:hypothetical protein [Terriglobales bacterium]
MAVGARFIVVILCAGLAATQAAAPRTSRLGAPSGPARKKPSAKKPEPAVEASPVQTAPPVPLRPSQMPAVAPRVSFQNGMLTIVAENSTMADIITQVRAATGIKIETIGGPSGDRVAARIGPAPVRDVLLSLLQGSQYDFIILGVEGQPNAVERVVLTQKLGGGALASTTPSRPPVSGNAVYQAQPQEISDDDGNEGFAPPPPAPANAGQPTAIDPNAPAKTPEQLLEELRRMEEQRNNPQGRPTRPPR